MKPRDMMLLGSASAIVSSAIAIATGQSTFVLITFASGAIFGKGYGIWEERNK